ncbi:MAG: hypothetical protein SVR94_18655, partial [Pseudomonadota bacterium]|nr:hypothetical protein [Pseudomonadota bacterium]
KDEMSRAYAKRAIGDYLWQIDVDEFYKASDMRKIISMLENDRSITAMSFRQITFFGGLDYWVDGYYLRKGATYYHRLFKWEEGFQYKTHRPPTVVNEDGVDLRDINWVTGKELEGKGIYLYHYSLLFPRQVYEKCAYYSSHWESRNESIKWYENNFLKLKNPFRLHNVYKHPGWIKKYHGSHPAQVEKLWHDIQSGKITERINNQQILEKTSSSLLYKVCVKILEKLDNLYWLLEKITQKIQRLC